MPVGNQQARQQVLHASLVVNDQHLRHDSPQTPSVHQPVAPAGPACPPSKHIRNVALCTTARQ